MCLVSFFKAGMKFAPDLALLFICGLGGVADSIMIVWPSLQGPGDGCIGRKRAFIKGLVTIATLALAWIGFADAGSYDCMTLPCYVNGKEPTKSQIQDY